MAEDRDYQLLIAFAKRKYNSDDKTIELFKKIAANQVEFHRGHSDLVEFLVAGQQAVCFTASEKRRADSVAAERRRGRNRRSSLHSQGRPAPDWGFALDALGT
jgi:hypothetical protein